MMKVLHFTGYDIGGAGHAAYQLHQSLKKAGIESCLVVRTSLSGKKDVVRYLEQSLSFRILDKLRREWARLAKGRADPDYCFFDREITYFNLKKLSALIPFQPDVIVAHSISGFLSMKELRLLQDRWGVPVIWHLMDMAPLTGGCHFAWGCQRYKDECGNCPALYSHKLQDQSYLNLQRKKYFASNLDVTIVAPSHALEEQTKSAAVFRGKPIHKILLAVDQAPFRKQSKTAAKQALNLPGHRRNIFFGAHAIKDRRKGVAELLEALNSLAMDCPINVDDVLLTTAGNLQGLEFPKAFSHRHLGYLSVDELSTAYMAADVFLCPSIEDSGPMMINEAITSGTPVVSFDIGVAPDLVITGVTGYRANNKSGEELANGLRHVLGLDDKSFAEMELACAEYGKRLCAPEVQAAQFISLFNEMKSRVI